MHGLLQAEQPVLGKEGIGPAMMIAASSASLSAQSFAEDASQPHPYPTVQLGKRRQ